MSVWWDMQKRSGHFSFRDINKSCVLIITGSRILREKAVSQPLLPGRGHSVAVSPFIRLLNAD